MVACGYEISLLVFNSNHGTFPFRIFTRNSEVKFYCIKMHPMALTLFHPLSEPAFSASFPQDFASLG